MFKSYWRWVVRGSGATWALAKRFYPGRLMALALLTFGCGFVTHWFFRGFDVAKDELEIGIIYGLTGPILSTAVTFLYYFLRAPVDEVRELKEQAYAIKAGASPRPGTPESPTDQERFADLASLLHRHFDEVSGPLELHLDKLKEGGHATLVDEFLSSKQYRPLRARLSNLWEVRLFPLGIQGRPDYPGPRYETTRLLDWQNYLWGLYELSLHGNLEGAIQFAHDRYLTNRSDDG